MKGMRPNSLPLDDKVRSACTDGRFVALPSGNTHYKIEGETGEWVVLTHGYATPYFIYDRIAEGLVKEGYRVLRYDLLGRGLSERVKGKYTPALFARQLDELTQTLLGEESFYLVGTSMGGTITTTFAATRPDKVKKLVLLAPHGMKFKVPAYMRMAQIPLLGELMFATLGGPILTKGCASELIYSGEEVRQDYRRKFAYYVQFKGMTRCTLSSLRHTILNFKESIKGYEGVARAGIPVLTIWGTADRTMPYYQAETMSKVLPSMRLITYSGSGHVFLYDEGERTLKDILPYLADKGE